MVVAITILTLSLLIIYQAASGAARNVRIDHRYTQALLLSQSLLAKVQQPTQQRLMQREGKHEEDYHWQLELSPIDGSAEGLQLYSVTVKVSWQDGPNSRHVQLNSVVARERL